MFDPAPSDDRVIAALQQAGLSTLIEGGIHRPLGSSGAGLSAGEAQLLALARVWLRDPDLVVLDEATARVDPQTERQIEHGVRMVLVADDDSRFHRLLQLALDIEPNDTVTA